MGDRSGGGLRKRIDQGQWQEMDPAEAVVAKMGVTVSDVGRIDWRALLASAREVVWVMAPDQAGYFFLNEAAEAIYGRSRADFLADPNLWIDVVHPDDRHLVEKKNEVLAKQGHSELQYRINNSDGTVKWLHDVSYQVNDREGHVLCRGGLAREITEQIRVEQSHKDREAELHEQLERRTRQAQRAHDRFREFFLAAGDAMYTITSEGIITALNPAWERATGHAIANWLNRSFAPLVHPDDLAMAQENFARVLAGATTVTFEVRHQAGSGEYRWAEHTLAAVRDDDLRVIELVGSARDLADRRRAEDSRHNAERQMQRRQRLESLGVLAGGIAHDFNNLLMGVMGHAELALVDMDGESSLKQHLEAIKQASIHLSELTQQMLVYAGRGHAVVAPLDLSALVSELSTLLMASLSKKIALRLELAADLGLVEADAGKVQQLVLNLITNAAEAIGDASGTVVVRTALVSRDWVEAKGAWVGSPLSSQSYVLFEVSDDGCGMDDETRVRMFDPFFTTKVTGRGLGLAAVLGIMRSHKGAIRFDSQLGAGSTGRAIFPCEAGALKVDSSPPLSINGVRRQGTVLLVDDEELVRHVSTLLLQSVGYTVEIACDGAAALDILRQRRNRIQLVVIDMLMPGMTGAETLAEIRRTWTDLPVILSSGYGEVADGLVANWSRAAFLQKPYTISQLLERIDRLLEP